MKTSRLSSYISQLESRLRAILEDKRLMLCLVSTFLWGLAAHSYDLLNNNPSHDELNAFYATNVEITWKLRIGRFFVPIFQRILHGRLVLPWVLGLLAFLFIGLSLYMIVRMFSVDNRLLIILAAGVLVTNLTVTAQIATYIHELDCNFLSLFFSVLGVYIWKKQRGWLYSLVSILFLFLSVGIYQSYISVGFTLMMLLCITDLYCGKKVSDVITQGLRGILILAVAIVGYTALSIIFFRVTNLSGHYDLLGEENFPFNYIILIPELYRDFKNAFFNLAYPEYFRPVLYLSCILLGVNFLCSLKYVKHELPRLILICILVFLLPLGMNITFLLARGNGIHDLTYYSIWFVWLIYLFSSFRSPSHHSVQKALCILLVSSFLWQNIILANTAYMKKEAAEKGTYATLIRVIDRLEQREDYVFNETSVAFIGCGDGMGQLDHFGSISNLIGMDYNNSLASGIPIEIYNTYTAYFRYVLNYPIQIYDPYLTHNLHVDPDVIAMPTFPHKDSIQNINGVLVVKLGSCLPIP